MASTTRPTDGSDSGNSSSKLWITVLLLAVIGVVLAWQFVGDAPPKTLVVATGSEGGGYDRSAQALKRSLGKAGITVELRRTAGSVENLDLLRTGEVDLAYVQGGVAQDTSGLAAIASLYYEPLWVFCRSEITRSLLTDLVGLRLQIGADGSGTRSLVTHLLEANGIGGTDATLLGDSPSEAIASLREGRADIAFLVVAPEASLVRDLFADDLLQVMPLVRAEAISKVFRALDPQTLTPGMIDLVENLPDSEVPLLAASAQLVSKDDLHPAIPPLLIEALRDEHGPGRLFEAEGEFPSLKNSDFAPEAAAENYFRNGPSFLYRVLPFQVAAAIDRLKILLLPLITLLFPLMRLAPPAYRWRIRSKIIRWYKDLLRIEEDARGDADEATHQRARTDLAALETEIAEVRVPLGYAGELYDLRLHVDLVRQDLERRAQEPGEGGSA